MRQGYCDSRDDRYWAMIIAVAIMGMMQATIYQVTDMVAMWNGFVPTSRSMNVAAFMID